MFCCHISSNSIMGGYFLALSYSHSSLILLSSLSGYVSLIHQVFSHYLYIYFFPDRTCSCSFPLSCGVAMPTVVLALVWLMWEYTTKLTFLPYVSWVCLIISPPWEEHLWILINDIRLMVMRVGADVNDVLWLNGRNVGHRISTKITSMHLNLFTPLFIAQ